MPRTVIAAVTDPAGTPREALPIYFHAPDGHEAVVAMTDASGVFRAPLEVDVTYRVSVENAVTVDGQVVPAGTVIAVRVGEGEGDVAGVDAVVGTVDASRPALLDTTAALTDALGTLLDRLDTTALALDLTDLRAAIDRLTRPTYTGGITAGAGLADLLDGGDD